MTTQPPSELDPDQFAALIKSLTPDQMAWMLWYLSGYSPKGFDLAYEQVVEIPAAIRDRGRLAAAPCGDIATHTRRSCELQPGHEGWHQAGQITWPWIDDLAAAESDPANPYGSMRLDRLRDRQHYDAAGAGVGPTDAGPAVTTTDAPATAEPPAGETVEFTTDSRAPLSAPCQQPEVHGFGLTEADWLAGRPLCDVAAHHVAASIPADGAR